MWQVIKTKLLSRKFLLTLGGILGYVLLAISGTMPWTEAMKGISVLILLYVGVEGAGDIAQRARGG